jgi:hypothetical protein
MVGVGNERQVEHASVSWWDIEVGAVTVFLDTV